MPTLIKNIRYGARMLAQNPGLTVVVAVLALALVAWVFAHHGQ